MPRLGETQDLFGPAAAVALPSSFDLGPTAREAGAWTQLRRRLSGAQGSVEPIFSGGSFDTELFVQQAGAWTQLRRGWDEVELPVPPLPRLSGVQLGALLGAFVVSCALVRPWTPFQGTSGAERSPIASADAVAPAAPPAPWGVGTRSVYREAASVAPALPLGSIQAKLVDGKAVLPPGAPTELKGVVAAANRINGLPYSYGGGHGSFESSGYDCSGAVSYALHGGGMLDAPLASGSLMSWGSPGEGKAITVYAHGGHTYAVIAGLRWDTSGTSGSGPSWHQDMRSSAGYVARHPSGF